MTIHISIITGPLPPSDAPPVAGAGALLCFEGIVRPTEADHRIDALDYEVYEPMATRQLHRLAKQTLQQFQLLAIHVEHSRGRVNAGQCSFRLRVWSRHRAEGLQATAHFVDQMKQDVPIWKRPVHSPIPETAS